MTSREQVDRLLTLIRDAAYKALDEYDKHGGEVPSLDSLVEHPLDQQGSLRLKKSIRILEGACDQLCTTLATPLHTITNRAQDAYWAALRAAVKTRIADVLKDKPNGLHSREIAEKIQVEEGKVTTILRLLATRHCFREGRYFLNTRVLNDQLNTETPVDQNVFANNRLSVLLMSNHYGSGWVDLLTKDPTSAALNLQRSLEDPEYALSKDPQKSAFMFSVKDRGLHGTVYDILRSDPEKRHIMGKAMVAMNQVSGTLSVLHVYPWAEYQTVCDVGSGIGSFAWNLLKEFPRIRVVLHDLPETINLAKATWEKDHAQAITSNRVDFAPGSFFDEIPATGCGIYYLRNIIHNWPDAQALTILRNVRKAMAPDGRVLIHDYVMKPLSPLDTQSGNAEDIAEYPLLPNFGAGQIRLYNQDMTMMLLYNSKERTVEEVSKLGLEANLKLEKVWDLGETSVIELVAL